MESLILNHKSHQDYCSVENSLGAIVEDNLLIHQDDILLSFKVDYLAKVSFHKTRNYFFNFVFCVLALLCAWVILCKETTLLEYIIVLALFISCIIMSYKLKIVYYTFLILTFNLAFIKIKVKSNQVKEAEELLVNVNEKLKARSESFIDRQLSYFIRKI